jgi:hypothetical protein
MKVYGMIKLRHGCPFQPQLLHRLGRSINFIRYEVENGKQFKNRYFYSSVECQTVEIGLQKDAEGRVWTQGRYHTLILNGAGRKDGQ